MSIDQLFAGILSRGETLGMEDTLEAHPSLRNMFLLSSRIILRKPHTSRRVRQLSSLYGILLDKKNTIDCDPFHTLKPTCSSSASPSIVPIH